MSEKEPVNYKINEVSRHEIKCWSEYFWKIKSGLKNFELRFNDRDYQVGDILYIHEWDNFAEPMKRSTGNAVLKRISYMVTNSTLGLKEGYCILQLEDLPEGYRERAGQ